MGNRRNVIMLNGKHYDALTGKLIKESTQTSTKNAVIKPKQAKSGSMDGVVKTPNSAKSHITRSTHQAKRRIERSKTLMRSVVKKPSTLKTNSSSLNDIDSPKKQTKKIEHLSIHTDPKREQRAKNVNRSGLISKFGASVAKKTKYSPIPVAPEPKTHSVHAKPNETQAPKPTTAKTSESRFQSAVNGATSHTQPSPKRPSRRTKLAHKLRISPGLLNASFIVLTFIVIGGYFAYNNVPNLAMRLAATRSGIDGSLPEYHPAGFSMKGPIQYQPGQITIGFHSNSDDRNYTVTQRASKWDSETLLENHVASNKRAYQTFQDKGKTIYIYDGDSASWVDNGIWYEVNGNTSLDTDQVLRIANSL